MKTNEHYKESENDEFNSEKRMELLQMGQAVNLLGSWEWDLHTDQILWTDAMFQLRATPVSTDNLISFEKTIEFIHPEDREMVMQKFELAKRKNEVSFEYRIVTSEGETKLVSAWVTLFKDENGEPRYLRGTSQDITRQREAEERLQELNKSFRHAEEIANMGNWHLNFDTGEIVFSDNLYKLLGCEPKSFERTYTSLLQFIHEDDKDKFPTENDLKNHEHETSATELRIKKKDGEAAWVKMITKLFEDKKGSRIVLGTIQDITEEVLLRKELEERKVFAEMLFENSVDLIAAFNPKLEVVAWNKTCEERYNRKKEEVLGKHVTEVFPHMKDDSRLRDLDHALKGNLVHRSTYESNTLDGSLEYFILPLKTSNDEIIGALTIAHDLSAIQAATSRLDELNQSLEQKNYELERSNNLSW